MKQYQHFDLQIGNESIIKISGFIGGGSPGANATIMIHPDSMKNGESYPVINDIVQFDDNAEYAKKTVAVVIGKAKNQTTIRIKPIKATSQLDKIIIVNDFIYIYATAF